MKSQPAPTADTKWRTLDCSDMASLAPESRLRGFATSPAKLGVLQTRTGNPGSPLPSAGSRPIARQSWPRCGAAFGVSADPGDGRYAEVRGTVTVTPAIGSPLEGGGPS